MCFYGYHGAIPEENRLGQRFYIDAVLYLPLEEAGKKDELPLTVHYGEVYETIEKIVKNTSFKLIEAVAEKIAYTLFKEFSLIQEIKLQIRKPSAPIAGILDYVAVEIRRRRDV